ncbi:MAG: DUF456 domain-containing protein [Acidimicrobiales bacterium]
MSAEVGWSIAAVVIMVVGLCGVIIPVLPGLALIWGVALIYGFLVGFGAIGISVMVVLTVLLAISIVKGVIIPRRTAAESGASGWSQLGGLVGAVIGFFLIPIVGFIVGALVGVLLAEVLIKGQWDEAWTATKGLAKGFGISALIDLVLGLVMIAAWAGWAASVIW